MLFFLGTGFGKGCHANVRKLFFYILSSLSATIVSDDAPHAPSKRKFSNLAIFALFRFKQEVESLKKGVS